MKRKGENIVCLTAYDAPSAQLLNEAGIDVILVGDSVANVKLGYPNTLPVTFEEMLHHVRAASRGNTNALLVADMPYLSYEIDIQDALKAAGRFIKEGGAEAVKLEGGTAVLPVIKELIRINIPVMGHLGLTPQSINRFGGNKVQGRSDIDAHRILNDAQLLEDAGVFSVVLECIPSELAREITHTVSIPTIGIGAGRDCDGQILVIDDLLGMGASPTPKFVKKFANLRPTMLEAVRNYCADVRSASFPEAGHTYTSSAKTRSST